MIKRISYLILPWLIALIGCGNSPTSSSEMQNSIVDTSFSLTPTSYKDYSFTVDQATQTNVVVKGSFSVVSNAILVLVMTDNDFLNWQAGGTYNVLYESGEGASGELNLSIPDSGTYHVVYSNKADSVDTESVTTAVSLYYTPNGSGS